MLRMANPKRFALWILEGLHAKMFVVDNEMVCLTSREHSQSRSFFIS